MVLPILAICITAVLSGAPTHTFALGQQDFLLDGKPVQIMSGEMHPDRIPEPYWRQRIQMAKAMGLNTIAAYVFWNNHELREGAYDFSSDGRDLGRFLRLCQEEGMWVLLRPGPYCCGEWDFGGIPPYLLKYPDLKIRCMDPRYIHAVSGYLTRLAEIVRPYQISSGGPILMVQIENEYGSYGNDRNYIKWLHDFWRSHGIDVPFYTADGAADFMLEAGSYPGCAIGLDPGVSTGDFEAAHKMNPDVPAFSSETYPGWLTHWGEEMAKSPTSTIIDQLKFLMDNRKSFNLYVVHGGTNFGFSAGANSGGKGYQPDITSYDYDAPITEQGRATPKYEAIRNLLASYEPGSKLPAIPAPIPVISIQAVQLQPWTSLWDHLPPPIDLVQPKPFEELGFTHGLVLYRTKLIGHKSGHLVVTHLHDFGQIFLDGRFVGMLDRSQGLESINLPRASSAHPTLDILVEAMGHINYGSGMIDRKGITERVTLEGMILMNWQAFQFPLDSAWVGGLSSSSVGSRPGVFFRASFKLNQVADTYIDMSHFTKGYVWINGHNLGRYWNIGPQRRLYCPASWLHEGDNTAVVLDLVQLTPGTISGAESLGP